MIQDTAENLQNMTHTDFAVGMQNGTIECWLGEPYELRRGLRKALFNVLTLLYMVGPVIFIPLWAYHVSNWLLLIGVAISYVATLSAGQYSRIVFLFGCYWIGFLIHSGFSVHHYTTFYFFCALCGYLIWQLADTVRMGCARRSLIDSDDLYDDAIAANRIRIVRLDSSQNVILMPGDIDAKFTGRGLSTLPPFPTVLVFSNVVGEAFTYLFGVFTGLIGTAKAYAQGIDNLAPEKADSIMRRLKKGTVGLAALALGYVGAYKYVGLLFGIGYFGIAVWTLLAERKAEK